MMTLTIIFLKCNINHYDARYWAQLCCCWVSLFTVWQFYCYAECRYAEYRIFGMLNVNIVNLAFYGQAECGYTYAISVSFASLCWLSSCWVALWWESLCWLLWRHLFYLTSVAMAISTKRHKQKALLHKEASLDKTSNSRLWIINQIIS